MKTRIAFTGGGSGGHVFPGIAVIERLTAQLNTKIFWIGSRSGVERRIVERHGLDFYGIPAGKLRRYFSLHNLFDVFRVLAGLLNSFILLLKKRPALLFSKGGYVTVPPVLAAHLLGIPVVTHESDFDPGLATRINARFADKILVSYPETAAYFPKRYRNKIVHTGNPVREAILTGDAEKGRSLCGCPSEMPLILVLGGSLGSDSVNNLIYSIKDRLAGRIFLVHQTGRSHDSAPQETPVYFPRAFFNEELPHLLAAADLVVCRAGANTLWELAASGKPSILIPLPATASRGDQLRNARVFERLEAGVVFPEEKADPQQLLALIIKLLDNNERLKKMGREAGRIAIKDSGDRIARVITDMLQVRRE